MKKSILLVLLIINVSVLSSQNSNVIYGHVYSETGDKAVSGVYCLETKSNLWTITDNTGFFSLPLFSDSVNLIFSHAGYVNSFHKFNIKNDTLLKIYLQNLYISEVTIYAKEEAIHKQTLSGKITIPASKIQNLPSFAGIPDFIKAVTYLPGISGGKDGFSNLYVRGGNRDQNLVLIDNIPIYNTSHFPGFVSLINSNIINELDIYKGGFPAQFGGKLSSVIDIKTINGNNNKLKGKINIGILNSNFEIDGPIKKDKTNFVLAGRTSYYSLFSINSKKTYKNSDIASYMDFTFFDIYSKIIHKINNKHKIFLSGFTGHDFYEVADKIKASDQADIENFGYKQHNTGITINHNFIVKPTVLFNQSVNYSVFSILNYSNYTGVNYSDTTVLNNIISTEINDISYRFTFNFFTNKKQTIKIGSKANYYRIQPALISKYYENSATYEQFSKKTGIETNETAIQTNVFIEDEIKFSKKFNINVGIRANMFNTDTIFFSMEPRISLRWLLSDNISFKSSYTHMTQFLHVLINNSQGIGQEIWLVSDKHIIPETAKQFSFGIFGKTKNTKIEYGIESFYKKMDNLLHYKFQGINEDIISDWNKYTIKDGQGISFGAEIYLKKKTKFIETSVSYTFSKSTRHFTKLNNGKEFPYLFDKTHDLSLNIHFSNNNGYIFGGSFVYNTGTPITLPNAYVKADGFFYSYYAYTGINNMRLPAYHRLDVFAKKTWSNKKIKKYLSINIYNVYAHKNAVYLYYDKDVVKQKSLFTILPTVNFGIKF